jgi:hypothetical protein
MTYHCRCGFTASNWPAMHEHARECDLDRLKLQVETFFRTLAWWYRDDAGALVRDPEVPASALGPPAPGIPESFRLLRWSATSRKVWVQFEMTRKNGERGALVKMTLPAGAFARWRERDNY